MVEDTKVESAEEAEEATEPASADAGDPELTAPIPKAITQEDEDEELAAKQALRERKQASALFKKFLKASGFKSSLVDDWNERTRVFVTTPGGKYQLTKQGNVRTIKGPNYPNYVEDSE